jgi:hypothetical protein
MDKISVLEIPLMIRYSVKNGFRLFTDKFQATAREVIFYDQGKRDYSRHY